MLTLLLKCQRIVAIVPLQPSFKRPQTLLKCQRIVAIVPLQPSFKRPQTLLIMLQTSVMSMTDTVLSYTNKRCAHVWPHTYQETPEGTIKHAHTCACARMHTHMHTHIAHRLRGREDKCQLGLLQPCNCVLLTH